MDSTESSPTLCEKGCGFHESPATQNLCSKCYKDVLNLKHNKKRPKSLHITKKPSNPTTTTLLDASTTNKKNRCQCCKRKVGLTGCGCRCGVTFCGSHRYPEEHACDFDFKTLARVELAKQNPLCKADKLIQKNLTKTDRLVIIGT